MHFICSTFGSSGDVFPMLGLAVELQRRGHQVTFATNEHYRPVASEAGLKFEALGDEQDFEACIKNPDVWHPRRSFGHIFRSLQPILKRQFEIHAVRHAAGNVIGITNCFGFGALTAQDKLGLPVITLHCQPAVLWSDRQPPRLPGVAGPRWLKSILYRIGEKLVIDATVCPFLNLWRAELDLPPVRQITRYWNSNFAVLCMFPDWYAPPQSDWPPQVLQTDFPLWNHRSEAVLPKGVESFLSSGSPPIVFTPGSANIHGRSFFAAALEACHRLGRRAILLTEFPAQLPLEIPPTIAHYSYVPLDLLLPHAAAFVHHGGIGSTSQAMAAGIPQVLMPLAHDQFDNAQRTKRLGVGAAIPATKFTARRLTTALQGLLENRTVTTACRQIAVRLTDRDGLVQSADAVEQLVAQKAGSVAV